MTTHRIDAERVEAIVADLSVAEQASLTAGEDVWHLPALERLGIGRLKMSDGPSGVRGEWVGTRRSLAFPCGMAVGASWDTDLVGRYGAALGQEAASKGVHLLLGPTVCIPRTPLGGRTFESFAEDPWLSSRLTVAYVRGVQATGVGCCVKHFACNDQEHERMTISVAVDDATLREVHLASFEAAVREAGAWSIMSAYNRVDGTYAGEHPRLLGEILKGEWGFDGVVVSDWFGTHSTVEATTAGLDVEMPGRAHHLGRRLATAVDEGAVDPAVLADHARRIVGLMDRTGLLDHAPKLDEDEDDAPDRRAIARELAVAGTVLLRNEGLLPLDVERVSTVAVIGPNGDRIEVGGGGSSSVVPHHQPSFVEELRDRLPGVEVTFEPGTSIDRGIPPLDLRLLGDGFRVEYFDGPVDHRPPAATDTLHRSQLVLLGEPVPGLPVDRCSIRATATFTPDATGPWELGLANAGAATLLLDGEVLLDNTSPTPGRFFYGQGSSMITASVDLAAGEAHRIEVHLTTSERQRLAGFEVAARRPPDEHRRERALAAAAAADAVILVVGSNSQWESEGGDRSTLHLVGDQDELAAQVVAANPNTAVVVNAGSPVATPWADDAAAVAVLWYPGEEGAGALADIVTGRADPGGRLPITFPRQLGDSAAHAHGPEGYPGVDGTVTYGEGRLIGHRHLDAHGVEPAFAFGHGLSFTTFAYGEPTIAGEGTERTVTLTVTNTGGRAGSDVIQLYVGPVEAIDGLPLRELEAFAKVHLEPGASTEVDLHLDERSFAHWDPDADRWSVAPGTYELSIGASSRDLRHRLTVEVAP